MKSWIVTALALCLFLTGCEMKSMEGPAAPNTEPSTEPTRPSALGYPLAETFYVGDGVLTKNGQTVAQGTDCSELGESTLEERFENSEEINGIFPHHQQITLVFEDELPTRIYWKTDDGFGTGGEGEVVPDGEGKALVNMGYNRGAPLSSDLYYIPIRKLRLVFEYADRSAEYLMVMEDTTRLNESQ